MLYSTYIELYIDRCVQQCSWRSGYGRLSFVAVDQGKQASVGIRTKRYPSEQKCCLWTGNTCIGIKNFWLWAWRLLLTLICAQPMHQKTRKQAPCRQRSYSHLYATAPRRGRLATDIRTTATREEGGRAIFHQKHTERSQTFAKK